MKTPRAKPSTTLDSAPSAASRGRAIQRRPSPRSEQLGRAFRCCLLALVVGEVVSLATVARADQPSAATSDSGPGELEGPMHPAAQALYERALRKFETRDYPAAI